MCSLIQIRGKANKKKETEGAYCTLLSRSILNKISNYSVKITVTRCFYYTISLENLKRYKEFSHLTLINETI